MLRRYFEKIAIQKKLYTMHFLVTGAAMCLVFAILVAYQYMSFKHDLLGDLDAQVSIVNNNLGPAILFNDKLAADETLSSLNLNSSIENAYIVLEDNSVFAEYHQEAVNHPKLNPTPSASIAYQRDSSEIHITREIFENKQRVGTIVLNANFNKINSRIQVFSVALLVAVLIAMFIAKVISRYLNRYITEPISYLKQLVTQISDTHDYTARSAIQSSDEIGALSAGINDMLDNIELRDEKLLAELAQKKVYEEKLDQLAYFDNQTTLPNRHYFAEHISKLINEAPPFYLLMLDLDNFKVANDTLGHEAGDILLKLCGQRLEAVIGERNRVFRIGGDEFSITLENSDSPYDVEIVCNRIIHAISQKFIIGSQEVFVGVSIGAVQYINGNYSESNLIKNADIAMYWAKSDGKNTYKFYSKKIEDVKYQQQKMIGYLQKSLKNNELEMYYQPIIRVDSGLVVGVEALLRWNQPELGMVEPIVFIPIAENTGLINPIGTFVINTALNQIKKWQVKYNTELFININISGRQFHDRNIVSKISAAIYKNGINPKTINFELTESVLMDDINKSIQILKSLRKLGTSVSIDDFGTGHSSMSYLKQLPINTIKIDKSFIHGVPQDKVDTAIIESIFALAKSLELDIVAEGVETEEQFAFIKKHHCAKAQGFLFSKPIPAQEIEAMFDQFYAIHKHQPKLARK